MDFFFIFVSPYKAHDRLTIHQPVTPWQVCKWSKQADCKSVPSGSWVRILPCQLPGGGCRKNIVHCLLSTYSHYAVIAQLAEQLSFLFFLRAGSRFESGWRLPVKLAGQRALATEWLSHIPCTSYRKKKRKRRMASYKAGSAMRT